MFIFTKKQFLVLLIFTIVSFIYSSSISDKVVVDFFPLLIFDGFVVVVILLLLFPVVVGVKLDCLFNAFLAS